jgi:hypothetical protein
MGVGELRHVESRSADWADAVIGPPCAQAHWLICLRSSYALVHAPQSISSAACSGARPSRNEVCV